MINLIFRGPCFGPYYGNYQRINSPTKTQQFTLNSTIEIREVNDPFIYLYKVTNGKLKFDPLIDSQV